MSLLEIILIAIGLAMDCFAVSIASSICYGKYNWPKIVRMALFFGLFQGGMPLIGWACGISFAEFIHSIDHWLALGILGFLGGKMIYESFKDDDEDDVVCEAKSPYGSLRMVTILAVATSIDALATGLIFVPLGNLMFSASGIIAIVSFLFTIVGCSDSIPDVVSSKSSAVIRLLSIFPHNSIYAASIALISLSIFSLSSWL